LTERAFLELHGEREIRRTIASEACRLFYTIEDRQDAAGEAWKRLWSAPAGRRVSFYQDEVRRAIHALYERQLYRRHREAELFAAVRLVPELLKLLAVPSPPARQF
jgi:hypothetical protein